MSRRARRKQLADVSVYVASTVDSVAAPVPTRTVVLDEEPASGPHKRTPDEICDEYRNLVSSGNRNAALQNITSWLRDETHANGAAIALRVGEEFVCLTSVGTAPPTGVTLDPSSGISGACIQSGKLTICDDSATDPRVNRAAGQYIRSIVAAPVKSDSRMDGLVEILSTTPYAFDRNHQRAVERVAEIVCTNGVRPAAVQDRPALLPVPLTQPDVTPERVMFTTDETPGAVARGLASVKKVIADLHERSRAAFRASSQRTKIAAFVAPVLIGGVLLVWSVGHTNARVAEPAQPVANVTEAAPPTTPEQTAAPALPQSDNATANDKQQTSKTAKKKVNTEAAPSDANTESPITLQPVQPNLLSNQVKDEQPVLAFSTPPSIAKVPLGGPTKPVVYSAVPAQRSGGELLHKVTPTFPRAALAMRLSGKVELMATVAPNGKVSKVRVVGGEPQFVQAAVEAVSQWRYKPLLVDGRPTAQELPITISFKPRAD